MIRGYSVKRVWVEDFISATHRRKPGGEVHGHTWQIRVTWTYRGQCADALRRSLRRALEAFDHKLIPNELARGEDFAEYLGQMMNADRVDVWRACEGIGAEWVNDQLCKQDGDAPQSGGVA